MNRLADVRKIAVKPLVGMIDDPDPGVRVNAILVLAPIDIQSSVCLRPTSRASVSTAASRGRAPPTTL